MLIQGALSICRTTGGNKMHSAEIYISGGCGSAVRMDVKSSKRNRSDINYTVTTNFEHDSIKNSLDTAYYFAKSILEKTGNKYLDANMLHFSVKNKDFYQHRYTGPSSGSSIALCILSECLQRPLPGEIAITGQISGHGELHDVGSVKEKLLAASKLGKTVFYVPKDNAAEATDLEIRDMSTVLRDLWDI